MKDCINVDIDKFEGTDVVHNLDEKPYPFKTNSIDNIYANSLIEHLLNLDTFFSECKRILKPHGKLKIITDNSAYILYHLNRGEHSNYKATDTQDRHYHLFSLGHLINLSKKYGFEIISVNYKKKYYSWRGKLFLGFMSIFGKKFSSPEIKIVLTKK